MTYLTFFITVPLTLFALVFAAANTDAVVIKFLLVEETFSFPLYQVGLGMLGLGFFSGALFVWMLYQKLRFDHWRLSRRARRLEKELEAGRAAG